VSLIGDWTEGVKFEPRCEDLEKLTRQRERAVSEERETRELQVKKASMQRPCGWKEQGAREELKEPVWQ
jgi:hypothetical protein